MATPKTLKFAADKTERRKIDALKVYPRNPRTHSDEQVATLVSMIQEFGFTQPILVDEDDMILAGHGRRLAAIELELPEVPVVVVRGLTTDQKRAIVIADNKSSELAGWDKQLLVLELGELKLAGYELNLTGFAASELVTYLGNPGAGDPDAEVEPAPIAISRPGDVWNLGNHRIICGDSTDKETVAKVLKGAKPHLMVTDPPYGVDYDPSWREKVRSGKVAKGEVLNDDRADWREAWKLFGGDVAYIWQGDKQLPDMALQLNDSGFDIRNLIVWAKTRMVLSRGDYHSLHETCWYAVRRKGTGHWNGDRKQTTLWSIEHFKSDTGHGTQKPVECMKRPIENNSKPGDAVYEPFAGSGTTIIAAEMTSRICLAIELNPVYVDVCVRRWQKFTGQKATLQGGKRTFDQIEKDRAKRAA